MIKKRPDQGDDRLSLLSLKFPEMIDRRTDRRKDGKSGTKNQYTKGSELEVNSESIKKGSQMVIF